MIHINSYRRFIWGAIIVLIVAGCGGGSSEYPNDEKDPVEEIRKKNRFMFDRITIAGSSITFGQGYLGEKSYVGEVEKYLREEIADTVDALDLQKNVRIVDEPMAYRGKLAILPEDTEINVSLEASESISVAYAGGDRDAEIEVSADGQICGRYTIPAGSYKPAKEEYPDNPVDKTTTLDDGRYMRYTFRRTDPQAVKVVCRNLEDKSHRVTLRVVSGEFRLNFITNHMYYIQNAGIGGYEAASFLKERSEAFIKNTTTEQIVDFKPDLFIFESSTNDAKTWKNEQENEPSTNEWIVDELVPFDIEGKTLTLNRAVSVDKGDIVVMGRYGGDIQNIAVGIVAGGSGNEIVLEKIVAYQNQQARVYETLPDGIDHYCRIKRITKWEDRVKEVVRRVKAGVGDNLIVGIGTSGVPNLTDPNDPSLVGVPRRLMGYREKGKMMAEENGWFFVDFFQKTLAVEPGVDKDNKWSYGDNTHPNAKGWKIFGQAVIDVLK